jgi:hypothetical protein
MSVCALSIPKTNPNLQARINKARRRATADERERNRKRVQWSQRLVSRIKRCFREGTSVYISWKYRPSIQVLKKITKTIDRPKRRLRFDIKKSGGIRIYVHDTIAYNRIQSRLRMRIRKDNASRVALNTGAARLVNSYPWQVLNAKTIRSLKLLPVGTQMSVYDNPETAQGEFCLSLRWITKIVKELEAECGHKKKFRVSPLRDGYMIERVL